MLLCLMWELGVRFFLVNRSEVPLGLQNEVDTLYMLSCHLSVIKPEETPLQPFTDNPC